MPVDLAAAGRAWRSYRGSGIATRMFLAGRLLNAPLGALDGELRALHGRVLSVGCGHGLIERYIAEINPTVGIDGIELDGARVGIAEATAPPTGRVRVRVADVTRLDEVEAYDAALAIDLMHHVAADEQPEVAAALARSLRPGGTCLVKDIATRPAWKHAFNRLHDRVVAGPEPTYCRDPEDLAELFERAGLSLADTRRLGRLGPYPHYLLRLTRAS